MQNCNKSTKILEPTILKKTLLMVCIFFLKKETGLLCRFAWICRRTVKGKKSWDFVLCVRSASSWRAWLTKFLSTSFSQLPALCASLQVLPLLVFLIANCSVLFVPSKWLGRRYLQVQVSERYFAANSEIISGLCVWWSESEAFLIGWLFVYVHWFIQSPRLLKLWSMRSQKLNRDIMYRGQQWIKSLFTKVYCKLCVATEVCLPQKSPKHKVKRPKWNKRPTAGHTVTTKAQPGRQNAVFSRQNSKATFGSQETNGQSEENHCSKAKFNISPISHVHHSGLQLQSLAGSHLRNKHKKKDRNTEMNWLDCRKYLWDFAFVSKILPHLKTVVQFLKGSKW